MGSAKPKNFIARARTWATKHQIFGQQAFLRYVMLSYLDALRRASDEFVFKGGNLLWSYIRTPRATVDLDLSTQTLNQHSEVEELLRKACASLEKTRDGIQFELKSFTPVEQDGKRGASVTMRFQTDGGAMNEFSLDIVYKISDQFLEIYSLIDETLKLKAATIENIIADKIMTSERFGSGNTRMKDFDDLWRLSQNPKVIDGATLKRTLSERGSLGRLQTQWISDNMNQAWKTHINRYSDLPRSLEALFVEVNEWLESLL